jgi:predicted metal-dependent phosphoesterase TrpH
VPGYEPYLLCDFHVHTRWSDGRLTMREVIDLYGRTGRFDVIAITDHILMKRDMLARAGRLLSLGIRHFSVTEAELTQNHIRSKRNSHIIALNIRDFIDADQTAEEILKEIRRQRALSIACHPHHRTTRRAEIGTCYLWDHRKRLAPLVDVWEAANRDDLFSVTSLKHYPYVASSDFHKEKHLYSWKTLLRCDKNWEAIARTLRSNVDVALTLFRNGAWAA